MTPQPTTHLLYLHGFRSSPQSAKARRVRAWLDAHRPDVHWHCPQLPPSPREAMARVAEATAGWPAGTSAVVGSSLGGYYATAVGIDRGWPAVVLNPAVDPARDLAAHIGAQTAYHPPDDPADPQARFFFRREFIDELRALQRPPQALPPRCLAIIAQGDEVLDWREMRLRYAAATELRVVPGSDHALSDFDDHLSTLTHFLRLVPPCD